MSSFGSCWIVSLALCLAFANLNLKKAAGSHFLTFAVFKLESRKWLKRHQIVSRFLKLSIHCHEGLLISCILRLRSQPMTWYSSIALHQKANRTQNKSMLTEFKYWVSSAVLEFPDFRTVQHFHCFVKMCKRESILLLALAPN